MSAPTRAGYVALLGRPNVGKSTLLNRLLGRKLSITAPRPQTTRHAILGISTDDDSQVVYVDTPGLQPEVKRALQRHMNRAAAGALGFADLAVLVTTVGRREGDDRHVLSRLADFPNPVLLAVNQIDRLPARESLLPYIDRLRGEREFAAVVPISALKGDNVDALREEIISRLPPGEFFFPPQQSTTAGERFQLAELIREKLIRRLRDELPYALAVEIEHYQRGPDLLRAQALIWVERPGQKKIVIGERGETLKRVGSQVRAELERRYGCKVFLQTWVKVRAGWSDDERALQQFGYRQKDDDR